MRTVFVDVDTQIDFLYPAGALYAPGAERLLPILTRLNQYAGAHGIPVVSSADAHRENDREFREWPPHCVAGTAGQQKPAATLLEKRVVVSGAAAEFAWDGVQQFIVEKQALDVFSNPQLPKLLERLGAERYVVYGVVTEFCVRCAAMGLLRLGRPVELVTDAIQGLGEAEARRTLNEFTAAGGRLATAEEILR